MRRTHWAILASLALAAAGATGLQAEETPTAGIPAPDGPRASSSETLGDGASTEAPASATAEPESFVAAPLPFSEATPAAAPPASENGQSDAIPLLPLPDPTPPPKAEIHWRVENPFRFFTDPADTEVHRATYKALTAEQRRTPVLSAEHELEARHPGGWAATMVDDTCWDSDRNRFDCGGKEPYAKPTHHAVLASLAGVDGGGIECQWLTAPKGGPVRRGSALKRPCSEIVRLDVPYPYGLKVTVEIGGNEVAATDVVVRDIFVVGVGDSFGSGEGNPDIPVRFSPERAIDYATAEKHPEMAGYPARAGPWKQIGDKAFLAGNPRWLDTACRRSLYSHQVRAALEIAVEDPHRAVTFASLACSGAETTWGLFLRYKGNEWVPHPPEVSQLSGLALLQCGDEEAPAQDYPEAYHIRGVVKELKGGLVLRRCGRENSRPIDILMVSIGGNDVGFARLVANAVLNDQSTLKKIGGWFGEVHGNAESEALLKDLDERYKALNRAVHGVLHVPWEESDRVILTAYPPLAILDEQSLICPDGNAGMDVISTFNLSQQVARESSGLADRLQQVMKESATMHGWSFAEAHRKAFIGRGLCAGYTDNAFSIADDLRLPRKRDGKWTPYNPADYEAYAPRQRWFRTPNDAFLTGNFHAAGSVLQKALRLDSLSWFQVLLASTYSGAFHPTAEGHAAIADAVADKARAVLRKYGQVSAAAGAE